MRRRQPQSGKKSVVNATKGFERAKIGNPEMHRIDNLDHAIAVQTLRNPRDGLNLCAKQIRGIRTRQGQMQMVTAIGRNVCWQEMGCREQKGTDPFHRPQ